MKKLMLAAALVCVAAMSEGAAMAWNAGNLYLAKSATDGSFSTTQIKKNGTIYDYTGLVKAVVWETTSATAFDSLAAGDLFAAYKNDTTGSLVSGAQVYNGSVTGKGALNIIGTKSYDNGTPVYAAILYTYTMDGKDYYIENFAENTALSAQATTADLAAFNGGNIGGTPQGTAITSWTVAAIPEPTSGLLLLLGMAGLALRRRRA